MNEERKPKLLLVEDDRNLGGVLTDYLKMNNYDVTYAIDGEEAFRRFKEDKYDLCICDVMMPKKDGFTLARELKSIRTDLPIIFLTAKNMKEDVKQGYSLGAADYITKPFDTEILLYKVRAVLQINLDNNNKTEQEIFKIGKFIFNSRLRILRRDDTGERYKLSPKECGLLKCLCINMNDLLPRHQALMTVWGNDNFFTSRSMDVYVAKCRCYLKSDVCVKIENIHGEGFILIVLEEDCLELEKVQKNQHNPIEEQHDQNEGGDHKKTEKERKKKKPSYL
ncbi:MAG: response regulator transcription factor [Flavobacteriales bacterium AspAUS03]